VRKALRLLCLFLNVAVPLQWDADEPWPDTHYRVQWTNADGQGGDTMDAGAETFTTISLPVGKWKVTVVAYHGITASDPSDALRLTVARVEIQSSDDQRTWATVEATEALLIGQKFFRGQITVP
jgi:hypothetical protein